MSDKDTDIGDLCFSPNGSDMIAAVAMRPGEEAWIYSLCGPDRVSKTTYIHAVTERAGKQRRMDEEGN